MKTTMEAVCTVVPRNDEVEKWDYASPEITCTAASFQEPGYSKEL